MNSTFYFGNNPDILREHIADESIDLIYLDPLFNSKRDYSLLFKTPKGHANEAQITAFGIRGTESPRYPDLSRGSTGSKKAKVEEAKGQQGELF
jgi:hypothetical protein